MFENVNRQTDAEDRCQTDARGTGILLAYPFGSGELKMLGLK